MHGQHLPLGYRGAGFPSSLRRWKYRVFERGHRSSRGKRNAGSSRRNLPAAWRITQEMIIESDLVIALSREHRSEVVRTYPRANRYAFTLREFARVLEAHSESARATLIPRTAATAVRVFRDAIPIISSQRGYAGRPAVPEDDDVIDPYGRDQAVYNRSGREISDAVGKITSVIDRLRAPRGAHAAPVDPT
jgi:protein-tyrosine phosphatase